MKFVLIPDSFKGTLSSSQICSILKEEIEKIFPGSDVISIPVADGGEGTVAAFLEAVGGTPVPVRVKGPFFDDVDCSYGILRDGATAVIEMASCAGLPMVEGRKNPLKTTTYGVGEQILDAARRGIKRIIVGLGGSCTNDAACGLAAALGIKFYDGAGQEFVPTGGTLSRIERIDYTKSPLLEGIEIQAMCDITNPMYGPTGAAYVFGPQKGADAAMVEELDAGLRHLGALLDRDTGYPVSTASGAGAAGAMGAGMLAFLGSKLLPGIQVVLDIVHFDSLIKDADYIFTGEGLLDGQSLCGKVVSGIAGRAKLQDKPVIAIVGGVKDSEIQGAYEQGVTSVFTINRLPVPLAESCTFSAENLHHTAADILRLIKYLNIK
ncbi:MAG: glycerate kinase [Spirochaetia bacterium]|nr:glycerate kinase [Spirochaetia bacterium]